MVKRFPGGSGKEFAYNAGDPGLTHGLGRFPGGGQGNQLQYSCLENSYVQRRLVGYTPLGCTESDTTDQSRSSSSLWLRIHLLMVGAGVVGLVFIWDTKMPHVPGQPAPVLQLLS